MMRVSLPQPCFLFVLLTVFSATNIIPTSSQCLDDQKTLLFEFKNNLTFNTQSKQLIKWDETSDCCSLPGVGCDATGTVISLQLQDKMITSGITESSSLFRLKHMKKLNLAFNDFKFTSIPKGFSRLTSLTHLNMSNARFGGQVPYEISRMRSLVSLDLSCTTFGDLKLQDPSLQLLIQDITGLTELHLDRVDISSQTSNWSRGLYNLKFLTSLSLRECGISGSLESSVLQFHSLSLLRLDRNNLSELLPDSLANFQSLTTLSLSSSFLKGWFLEKIFLLSALQSLDLSYNSFLGETMPQFFQSESVREIKLADTNISGPLPQWISNLKELVYLDFSKNFFTGQMPSFQMSNKLNFIDLSGNALSGSLPPTLFQGLYNLEYIHLGSNTLSGEVPLTLFGLPSLRTLVLRINNFNGSISLQKFKNLRNIVRLELGHNNLSVDATNTSFRQLSHLNLASSNLYSFPDLRNLTNLETLDLSINNIHGVVPSWIWDSKLRHLNISHNLLVELQMSYNTSLTVDVLDVSYNKLQGKMPPPPPFARHVDYSNNYLHSTINSNFTNNLKYFGVSNNSLYGEIPTSLCNVTDLYIIDFSRNELSGSIPPCLMERDGLWVLNLGLNKLSGIIPSTFSLNCRLGFLILSENNLRGKLPASLTNCQWLVILDVRNNHINDTFPCMLIDSLYLLRALVLRNNKFNGDLGCLGANYTLPNLQIIDIASNNFSGYLYPLFLSSWEGMTTRNYKENRRFNSFALGYGSMSIIQYWATITLTAKGKEFELAKSLSLFTTIDISCNNFMGDIPEALGNFIGVNTLNLSYNNFNSAIPKSIGNMKELSSLDMSLNQLTGKIPKELASLTFVSSLNLSYNKLVGMIPKGNQFDTFTWESYKGNNGLCGFPLNTSCNDSEDFTIPTHKRKSIEWIYVFATVGFAVGLGNFIFLLFFSPHWRHKYFEKLDQLLEWIFYSNETSKRRRGGRMCGN